MFGTFLPVSYLDVLQELTPRSALLNFKIASLQMRLTPRMPACGSGRFRPAGGTRGLRTVPRDKLGT